MSSKALVDKDLVGLLEVMPPSELNSATLELARQSIIAMAVPVNLESFNVSKREVYVPVSGLENGIRCVIYEPKQPPEALRAGYFHIHGGGLVVGIPEISEASNVKLASRLGIVVISVDYRLAPEFPYPAPLDDCHSALTWMIENSAELGIDASRIAVGGESAGGGLAAGLVQRIYAERVHSIAHQHLTFPMLDDRSSESEGATDPNVGEFIWTRSDNRFGWSSYLGNGLAEAPAVPARAESLEGLPPTWIGVGGLDLFLDEDIAYARRLTQAGVATELVIYPSAYHGFTFVQDAAVTKRYERDHMQALARGLSIQIKS